MKITNCTLHFDERTNVVNVVSKNNTILIAIKLTGNVGTMTRIDCNSDCDNYWIAIKPSDAMIFDELLLGDSEVIIHTFDYSIRGGRNRKRRGLD